MGRYHALVATIFGVLLATAGGAAELPSRSGPECAPPSPGGHDGPAALPVSEPDVALRDSRGWQTLAVGPGAYFEHLQAAYDYAVLLDAPVRIQVAVRYDAGALVLRDRRGKRHWIYIEPASADALPPAGTRATRRDAPAMYQIRGELVGDGNGRIGDAAPTFREAIWAEQRSGFTRIIGADISIPNDEHHRKRSHVVRLRGDKAGSDPATLAETPQHIILDRSYVHLPVDGTRFTAFLVGLYGRHLSVIDSYIVGGGRGYEATKAIASNYAPGPLLIQNNYLAADGINIFFGADVGAHNGWVPSDITVRGNHIHKPREWQSNPQTSVKNGFEIKNAQRVLVEGNVFENNWAEAQAGKMILLRAESPDGVCEDVTFRFNRIVDTPAVWDIVGMDGAAARRSTRRISIHNNVAVRIGGNSSFDGSRHAIQFLSTQRAPVRDLLFAHNTHGDQGDAGSAISGMASNAADGCVFRDNILDHGRYGVKRDGTVEGVDSFEAIFGDDRYRWTHNVGGDFPEPRYREAAGQANHYPTAEELAKEFVDAASGDLRLVADSRYRAGGASPPSTGRMRGADVARVDCLTSGVVGAVTGE